MKPLPPSQVIAEYRAAFLKANGWEPTPLEYVRGWFCMRHATGYTSRYRGAQIIHMTATLNERAKAKG